MAHTTSAKAAGRLRLVVVWLLLLHAPALLAQVIRFAPEKDYAPFVSVTPTGQVQGLSMDVLDLLKPRLGAELQILPADNLTHILQAARRGEVDLISSLRPTPERAEFLAFTDPYVKVPAVFVVSAGTQAPSLKDLAGRPVAVGKGYAVESFVRANYPQVRWVAVPDDVSALRLLMRGDVDGVVADVASVSDATRHSGIEGVKVAETLPFEYELSFAYRKDLPALGSALNAGLKEITPATRQTLLKRWIDTEALAYEDARSTSVRKLGIALFVLVLAGAAVWQLRTKKKRDLDVDGR